MKLRWLFITVGCLVILAMGPPLLLEFLAKLNPKDSDGYAGLTLVWFIPFIGFTFAATVLLLVGIVCAIVKPFEKSN